MLYQKLKDCKESGVYPFHMPGHKRQDISGDGLLPYELDLTEIPGFDNLHNPGGCIKELEDRAAGLYGVNHAMISVNGATGGILAAVRSMTRRGDKVLMARNCHRSVYNAIELMGLEPVYLFPDVSENELELGIYGSVNPSRVDELLSQNEGISLVIITSPTYEGVCSDIASISKVCKHYNAALLVDEAHGAHFPFHSCFPEAAVSQGADAAVVSLHKTLPSLTQTALTLTDSDPLALKLRENAAVFETSSPSYILMASVQRCFDYIEAKPEAFDNYINELLLFYNRTKAFNKLYVPDPETSKSNFYKTDIGKIIIFTTRAGISGFRLAERLREEYLIETEMAAPGYVVAVTSVCDTHGGFSRLAKALTELDSSCGLLNIPASKLPDKAPERLFLPYEKERFFAIECKLTEAVGRAAMETVTVYPPGIPLLVPGEIISSELAGELTRLCESGAEVISSNKNLPGKISVAKI